MLKRIPFLLVPAIAAFAQDSAKEEAQVWNLEKAYWDTTLRNVIHLALHHLHR
jgi:hypothetical protein